MRKKYLTHEWDLSPKDAISLQQVLKSKVIITPLNKKIKTIAGADVSLNLYAKDIYAGIIVFSFPDLEPLAHVLVKSRTEFPYIPGLLSFREIPALFECFKKLPIIPDVIMVDGQGIAHPRNLGIASHFGILTSIPTIGCAKSKLYGVGELPKEPGESTLLRDPKTKKIIGNYLQVKKGTNPLIISPGHLITVHDSLSIVKRTLREYKLPEPIRQIHNLVNEFRKADTKN